MRTNDIAPPDPADRIPSTSKRCRRDAKDQRVPDLGRAKANTGRLPSRTCDPVRPKKKAKAKPKPRTRQQCTDDAVAAVARTRVARAAPF